MKGKVIRCIFNTSLSCVTFQSALSTLTIERERDTERHRETEEGRQGGNNITPQSISPQLHFLLFSSQLNFLTSATCILASCPITALKGLLLDTNNLPLTKSNEIVSLLIFSVLSDAFIITIERSLEVFPPPHNSIQSHSQFCSFLLVRSQCVGPEAYTIWGSALRKKKKDIFLLKTLQKCVTM